MVTKERALKEQMIHRPKRKQAEKMIKIQIVQQHDTQKSNSALFGSLFLITFFFFSSL